MTVLVGSCTMYTLHSHLLLISFLFFFFFNDPATTEIYTLSLHDALPISQKTQLSFQRAANSCPAAGRQTRVQAGNGPYEDRKSTRLNSSHVEISYAVFCLKKKKKKKKQDIQKYHTHITHKSHLTIYQLIQ